MEESIVVAAGAADTIADSAFVGHTLADTAADTLVRAVRTHQELGLHTVADIVAGHSLVDIVAGHSLADTVVAVADTLE